MTEIVLRRNKLHDAQRTIKREARRFNVVACGRRFGKTTMGVDLLDGPVLDGQPVGWFAATNALLAEAWRDIKRAYEPVTRDKSEQQHRIELITGGVVEMWSLEATGAGRGRKYQRAVIDEAASTRDLETVWNENIRPTLTDYQGDGWMLGTPKGRDYFWTLWMRGQDPQEQEWRSWQFPTVANPHISPAEVEAARADMPERAFLQEFEAQFIEDGAGVFRRVREAATAAAQDAAVADHQYVMGVDWGKHADFTVLTLIDTTLGHLAALERFNKIDYAYQLKRLTALYERFRPETIIPERNSMGEPLIEQLAGMDLPVRPFTTTNASKAEAIESLALALERGDLAILNDPVLVSELLAYESERLPSGLLRYTAPPGLHDDCVMSLALAYHGAKAGKWSFTLV